MTEIPVRTADVPSQSPSSSPSSSSPPSSPPSPEAPTDGGTRPSAREDLRSYAELGGFTLSDQAHAWYAAVETIGTPEEARAAMTICAELRGHDLLVVRDAATQVAEGTALGTPGTVGETVHAVALLLRVRDTLATLHPTAYEADLDTLAAATAKSARRKDRGEAAKISWFRRVPLSNRARRLAVSKRTKRDVLHIALVSAATERADWAALAPEGSRPALPADDTFLNDVGRAVEAAGSGLRELGRLLMADPGLETLPFADLAGLLDRLAADEGTLYRLPTLRTLRDRLTEHGLTDLLAELTARRADADEAEAAYAAYAAHAAEADVQPTPATDAAPASDPVSQPIAAEAGMQPPSELTAAAPEAEPESLLSEPELSVGEAASEPIAVEAEREPQSEPMAAEPEPESSVSEPEPITAEPEPEPEPSAAESEPEPIAAEIGMEVQSELTMADAEPEPEPELTVAGAEPAEPAEPAASVPTAEPGTDLVSDVPAVAERAEAEAPSEREPEPEPELTVAEAEPAEPEQEPIALTASEPSQREPEVTASEPESVVPESEPAASEPEPEAAVGAPEPAKARAKRRPQKPSLTPGRPITAYSASELTALVRWIDSDSVERTDDQLLRAAMKELGFARIGPRIREALGAAVAEVRRAQD